MKTSTLAASVILLASAWVSAAGAQVFTDCATSGNACTDLIPDANKGVAGQVESTIAVTDAACIGPTAVLDLDVAVSLIHSWVGDLRLTLLHPDGTTSAELVSPNVSNLGDDIAATFDDEPFATTRIPVIGGMRLPATPLAVFDGLPAAGIWTLRVEDLNHSGYGALRGWSMEAVCGLPTVTVIASDPVAAEPGIDTGEFTISRGEASSGALAVGYTIDGSATPGSDFAALAGTVTIPDGATSAVVTVQALDDTVLEDPETVVLTLSPAPDLTIGSPSQATVTIGDDGDLPTITIAATDPDAAEPGSDIGAFTVSRGPASIGELLVSYSVDGTAVPGIDYTALAGTVTIPDGATSTIIVVQPLDDSVFEGPETVVLSLLDEPGFGIGSPSEAMVTIADDDLPEPVPHLGPLGLLLFITMLLLVALPFLRRQ